ncbi:4-hydroxybenzoate solanesyltransferase [Microcoleus sp. FACHB-68]|uniref:4-hydroxybenzoate solanesyltransferase n=1 Tax=Microcoleus sp. FACHB-68 TaxID=2692826 RepID=UPI0016881763|nr:4-hydroxybenzoate solanesyltransferase [Microcoleus sp. FACHB-68]MBD1938915.1 4-hydroxybenzoate solanesyltransferase [Microcoleus sp. FACHB-68]
MLTSQKRQPEAIWQSIFRLLRWDKPAGRLILMIPALWAVFLAAQGKPPILLVVVIILGSLATSAAGCVVNDLWDRDIDPKVERTRLRPLASRLLSVRVGLVVAVVAFICAGILALYLNTFTFWLCVAALPVIIIYPLAKRKFAVPQLVLSVAWGFAVLISWSAVAGRLEPAAWVLWGATVLWTLGFDTVYAMSDREDDRRLGINSSALFFGDYAPEAVVLSYASASALLAIVGGMMHLRIGFWIALFVAIGWWGWQYSKLREDNLPKFVYAQQFSQNVKIGFILLAGMIIGSVF